MQNIKELPLLLRRKHLIGEFGLSDSLYYTLLKNGELPTVTLNGRKYIHRDKFINLINGLFGTDYPTDSRKQMETVIFSIFRNQGLSIFTPHQVYRMDIR